MDDVRKVHSFSAFNTKYAFNDDNFFSLSSTEQKRVEDLVFEEYKSFISGYMDEIDDESPYMPALLRTVHTHYICRSLKELPKSCSSLDASRPWFCYWGIHSLRLLEASIDESLASSVVRFLKTCESSSGGYGGGPGQYAHMATTYGAVMALVSIGTNEAFESINRKTLKNFLMTLKKPDGGFCLHVDGETDIRGSYCALAVASITNILDDELVRDADSWLISCQTYEGGFGGEKGCEAHGGYTFCGTAALTILGKNGLVHTPSLFKWLSQKQMKFEGGFQGRTNKLVDSCYSFWQASVFLIMETELRKAGIDFSETFDMKALQEYILVACQDKQSGGLRDKPDKSKDMYHTCYALSGLSIAQSYTPKNIVGGAQNLLTSISPVYNICQQAEEKALEYFGRAEKV